MCNPSPTLAFGPAASVAELEGRLADIAASNPELYDDILASLERHLAACEHFPAVTVPGRPRPQRARPGVMAPMFDPAYLAGLDARNRQRLGRGRRS